MPYLIPPPPPPDKKEFKTLFPSSHQLLISHIFNVEEQKEKFGVYYIFFSRPEYPMFAPLTVSSKLLKLN